MNEVRRSTNDEGSARISTFELRTSSLFPATVQPMKCPNCGGDASPDQVRCSWCQGSLATVACPSCFATIFTGMKHCPWCGAEVAKAEPLKQMAEACPHCQTTMTFVRLGASQLSECRSCGGIWVNKDSFEKICQDREQQEAVLGQPVTETLPSLVWPGRLVRERGPRQELLVGKMVRLSGHRKFLRAGEWR